MSLLFAEKSKVSASRRAGFRDQTLINACIQSSGSRTFGKIGSLRFVLKYLSLSIDKFASLASANCIISINSITMQEPYRNPVIFHESRNNSSRISSIEIPHANTRKRVKQWATKCLTCMNNTLASLIVENNYNL